MSRDISGSDFNAGSQFTDPKEALASVFDREATGETPADVPPEHLDEMSDNDDWAQQAQESAEGQPATDAKPAAPAAEPLSLEIKGAGAVKKFELNPENAELKKTLEYGVAAQKWRQERDNERKRSTELEARLKGTEEKASVWDELAELKAGGHLEQVAKAVLGDDFDRLREQIVQETINYENASPAERAEMDREKANRQASFKDRQVQKALSEREQQLQDREDSLETSRIKNVGVMELKRHDFRQVLDDKDIAQAMNQKLWKISMTELIEAQQEGREISTELISKTFRDNAKILGSGRQKTTAAADVKAKTEQVKQATTQAKAAATERYPNQSPAATAWEGKSAKSLLRQLVSQGR